MAFFRKGEHSERIGGNMPKKTRGKCVLVVDDEQQMVDIIKKILEQEGYQVFAEINAHSALRALDNIQIDLMLIDLKMPEMDGVELLKLARTKSKELPAIFLTAYGTAHSARDAMELGACDFLSKPFDNQILREAVKEALRGKE